MKLKDLDARVVPWAAERVSALATFLAVQRERTRASLDGLSLRDLRALDERYASRGPLGLLREVPQVGFVVIAAVFLIGAGTAVSRESQRNRQAQAEEQRQARDGDGSVAAATDVLGPAVGTPVSTYLTTAEGGLQRAAGDDHDEDRLALVSFTDYRAPAQVRAMLSGIDVRRVYLRVKAAGPSAAQLPVEIKSDLLGELSRAYDSNAARRRMAQKDFQKLIDTLDVTNPQEQAFKDDYVAFARVTGIEAQAYGTGCACVYAAVVETTSAKLRQLRSRPGVRAIELAQVDQELREIQVLTLLPETTGTVPVRQSDPVAP